MHRFLVAMDLSRNEVQVEPSQALLSLLQLHIKVEDCSKRLKLRPLGREKTMMNEKEKLSLKQLYNVTKK